MTSFPDAPKALLTLSSLFASPGWQASERERFAASSLRIATFEKRFSELVENVFEALSLPQPRQSELSDDFARQLFHFAEELDSYALHTATFGADERQILWTLSRDLAPALGRTWGFWCRDEPIMPDLPEGDLWFLPRVDPDHPERLVLPVAVVARWWRSLLEGPIEAIWNEACDDRHLTFKTWLAGKATPTPRKLDEWYADGQRFQYHPDLARQPETRAVRRLFVWARVLETGWKALVAGLTPDVAPDEPDPMQNKALQLVELFRLARQLTVAPPTNDPVAADRIFRAAVPEWLTRGDFWSILPHPHGRLPAAEETAARFSEHFRSLVPGGPLQDIFRDAAMDAPAAPVVDLNLLAERQRLEAYIQEGHAARSSSAPDRAAKVAEALARARAHPRRADMEADVEYLAALDALSRGNFEAARERTDHARELCATSSFGRVRLEVAHLGFALSVQGVAFNQNRCEADFRVISRSLTSEQVKKWEVGRAPLEYSMRLAAVETSQWLWEVGMLPYPGVKVERPLAESQPIFAAFSGLLLNDADESEIRAFLSEHKGSLKRKLRDVRGDTFLTMTAKMVPDLVARMRAMPPNVSMSGKKAPPPPNELAARIRATYLRFVRLVPTDVLSARDYLGQTALMLAADRKDVELVKILVERNVDLDAQDALGRTVLHSAVRSNAVDCFKFLLDAGANPTLETCEGKTPAIFAAEFGRAQIFQYRLGHRLRVMSEKELCAAQEIAASNEKRYKALRGEYRRKGVELGGRPAFREILEACSRSCPA